MASKLTVKIQDCVFNTYKGMWETDPAHWVPFSMRKVIWVVVAFPTATDLDRGVSA